MKRFLLFSGCEYYPAGGMDDFNDDFDDLEDAVNAAEAIILDKNNYSPWVHVYDTESKKEVYSS